MEKKQIEKEIQINTEKEKPDCVPNKNGDLFACSL